MTPSQKQVQPLLDLLLKLMKHCHSEKTNSFQAPIFPLIDGWKNEGGNGDRGMFLKCLDHVRDTPFVNRVNGEAMETPFIDAYEIENDEISIVYNQDYMRNYFAMEHELKDQLENFEQPEAEREAPDPHAELGSLVTLFCKVAAACLMQNTNTIRINLDNLVRQWVKCDGSGDRNTLLAFTANLTSTEFDFEYNGTARTLQLASFFQTDMDYNLEIVLSNDFLDTWADYRENGGDLSLTMHDAM